MDNEQAVRRLMITMLHELPGIGWHTVDKAVNAKLWNKRSWTPDDLLETGMGKAQANKVWEHVRGSRWLDKTSPGLREGALLERMVRYDSDYPAVLENIPQPPWVLYWKGDRRLLERPSVSIVGTRSPTAYGRHAAARLSRELAGEGLAVVSGLARGIDGIAHEAALHEQGGTIAVLPTPIGVCYPADHQSLYRRIADNGLLLSETPPGTALHKGQFRQRNRIIAGLSRATVVVEGAAQSGSLITADFAFETGRELFAVPGPIHSSKSQGPNELIRSGRAMLMSDAGQLFDELPWLRDELKGRLGRPDGESGERSGREEPLDSGERRILALLREEPLSVDELHERSGIPFGLLNAHLINLCIKRKIELQPGSIYMAL